MPVVRSRPSARAFPGRLTLALALLLPAVAASAASPVKGTATVSSSVANSCVIVSSDTIAFGSYDPTSAVALNGTGLLHLTCTKGAAVSAIPTSGGTTLTGAKGTMGYTLYIDSAMSKIWGGKTYTYITYDFSNSIGLAANFQQYVSQSACANLANGAAYYYTTGSQVCGYNLGHPGTGSTTTLYGANSSLVMVSSTGGQTTLRTSGNGASVFYIPGSTSTLVSGYTYTVPSVVAGASNQALTGTATSAKQQLNLAYYAKVPAGQDMAAGFYQDTVIVSVTF